MSSVERVRVRMYDVGFGDCFLISFFYDQPVAYDGKTAADGSLLPPRAERHMLMDFGSMKGAKAARMKRIAEMIGDACDGQLDVLAVSHRHKDHMSGFGLKDASPVIAALNPLLVVRSWTEDPDIDPTADSPSASLVRALDMGQAFAGEVAQLLAGNRARSLRGRLLQAAYGQVKNKAAVDNLATWGALQDEEYLHFGKASKIPDYIPGTTVRVIGPPTVEQYSEVTGQAQEDPEFWMLRRAFNDRYWRRHRADFDKALAATGLERQPAQVVDSQGQPVDPGPVRWLVEKMQDQHIGSLRRIVRDLDAALNNTSLILLIDVGEGANRKRMLLSGDAQIENWRFALEEAAAPVSPTATQCRNLLDEVDMYKVGHHGSRNATPRSLVAQWDDRPGMMGLMSTKSCFHGEKETTRVPRQTLVDALAERMRLFTTDHEWFELKGRPKRDFIELRADVTKEGGFRLRLGADGEIKRNDERIDCGDRGH